MRGVVGHRLGRGIPVTLVRSLPAVAPCDAWCQMAETLELDELITAGDRVLGWPVPLASLADLDAAIGRHGARRGAVRLRSARREIRQGSASPRETRLRLAVLRGGFPEPECNGQVRTAAGFSTHGDLVFRAWRVILEYDGDQHRTDARQFARDVGRLNLLALDEWLVVRVGRHLGFPDALALLDRALRSRGWSP
jgi:very-short-patch-repair endonuclease